MISEVAQLRARYELEYQAGKRALHDPAMVAPHRYINQRMGGMWNQLQHLEQAVGREEARRIIFGLRPDGAETLEPEAMENSNAYR